VRGETPSIIRLLMRVGTMSSAAQLRLARAQADLLIEPKLKRIDPLDWRAFDSSVEAGYAETLRALEAVELPLRRKSNVAAPCPPPWRPSVKGATNRQSNCHFAGRSMPKSLYGFIWQESGRQQVWLCLLTLLVVPLSTVPLELQRRIINDALGARNAR